ncbi:ATPase [Amycolatopsis antarctica]|uniref:ATPase n=1 Tax=Amycolatopsis antarctica TaxID=1854586 RepID=A0A263D9X9_9PSEU|nr:AAA family ATPase [Amycolatopsis antarctica]OZM74989.1 ATPase [Amycolatopsis antarctica]
MTSVLIGRDHPAELLRGVVRRAAGSHGGLVLVTGEAGIGKTTLTTGAAAEAAEQGALVLHGACWDSDSAPGYWPWVQVIRALRRTAGEQEWAEVERAAGSTLAALLGESRTAETIGDFALYDAVTTALVTVSARRPVLVVLDDLHWADAASLSLLEFAARHTWFERLLIVGTYRDVEVEAPEHPLWPLITPLVAMATTVTLTGLEPEDVAALIARTVGEEPGAALAAEVHRRTGGNPFFVEQTARLWSSGGSVTAVPPGVRDALQRRMSLLPAPVRRMLTDAAVLGREFHRQVLAAAASTPVPRIDRLLDQAVTSRLVLARGSGTFSFAHDLVRETLYEALDEADRCRRHAEIVRSVDRVPAVAGRMLPAELAGHAYLAGAELDPARAVDRLVTAARDASGRLATAEAIEHYRRAYERVGAVDDRRRRVIVSLDYGRELDHDGDRDGALVVFRVAADAARESADPALLARVALTVYRVDVAPTADRWEVDLLLDAYRALAGPLPEAEPRLDRLARELTVRVAELARGGADDDSLTFGLWARHDAIWGPGSARERVGITEELMALARRTADHEVEYFAASFRWVALLELGDERYLDQFHEFVASAKRARLARSDFASSVDQSIIYGLMGRFAESEVFLDRALEPFGDNVHSHFTFMTHHLRWNCWLLQGRFGELAELHQELAAADHPFPRLLEGVTAAEQGDAAALAALAEPLAAEGPYPIDFEPIWLRLQARMAVITGDAAMRERARADLLPYAGQWLVAIYGCDIGGPVAYWVAELDAAAGDWDAAVDGFTEAHGSADRLQARPWSLLAREGLGRALLGRGHAGDLAAARETLAAVAGEAATLGVRHVAEAAGRQLAEAGPVDIGPADSATGGSAPGGDPLPANEFHRDGAVWSVRFGGRSAHLPDAKGLRDLHLLLGRPGTDVPAVRLLNPSGGDVVVAARGMGGDAVLDEEAKAAYRRRLDGLDTEIDRAVERGDDDRAAALDRERQALLDELRSAAGLAGRTRRLGDEAERARKTVTARIRDTLRKLDAVHPELAAHLRASVVTGASCGYRPGVETRWRL